MPEGYDKQVAVRHLHMGDTALSRLIDEVGPCTLTPPSTTGPHVLFDRLASSILSQQLSVKAAATITGRLRARANAPAPARAADAAPAGEPPHGDPLDPARIAALDDDELRACGISRPKVAALRDLTHAVETARIPTLPKLTALTDEEVVTALTGVRGIGRWTVEMQLIFLLDRPDVFPVADVGVRRGFERTLELPHKATPAEMLDRSEAWAPYRSVASWYLWRAVDQTGQPASPPPTPSATPTPAADH